MSKILANQIANYGDDAPIEIKEGLNIPAGKPIQAAGSSGSSGQVLSTTGTSIAWVAVFDGDYGSLSNRPTIPAAQVPSDWEATGGVARILNKPIVPAQPSITTATAGTPSLSYNSVNGEFTYTPPDLSNYDTAFGWGNHANAGYLTSLGDAAGVTTAKISNWDTAHGWGDHSTEGYLTSYSETSTLQDVVDRGNTCTNPVYIQNKLYFSNNFATLTDLQAVSASTYHGMFAHVHAEGHGYFGHAGGWQQLIDTTSSINELGDVDDAMSPSDGYVLKWEASSSTWKAQPDLVGSGGSGIVLGDLSVNQVTASGGGSLSYGNTTGVFTYTPPDLSGYLTTETDPVFAASPAAGILSSNIANWDTAYGWGNHATAGYLTAVSLSLNGLTDVSFNQANLTSGDGLIWNGTGWVATTQQFITTESDPVFSASEAAAITSTNISNWNSAYGWGDHSGAGYLTTVALNSISDVTITAPSTNDVLTYNGSGWVNSAPTGGGGGANVTISDTIPAGTPSAGDLWWESDSGRLKVYYTDVDSSQWVDVSPPLSQTDYIKLSDLKTVVAASSDFADFQTRIAAL
tara:strand:- start:1136 stop:2857 length:1722 start_codon:yes stop_codon:yes gene_type:complete